MVSQGSGSNHYDVPDVALLYAVALWGGEGERVMYLLLEITIITTQFHYYELLLSTY